MNDSQSEGQAPTEDQAARRTEDQAARLARRAAASEARRRRRRQLGMAGAAAAMAAAAVVALIASVGGDSSRGAKSSGRWGWSTATGTGPPSPLAPAAVGGLASLWAAGNVVAMQPGTAAAYEAASRQGGLGGYILIADRGNNRMLVVDAQKKIVWRYPSGPHSRKLYYDDDTFVEPGGAAVIVNEEDNHAVVQVGIADGSLKVLFGHPGERGGGATHLNTPDDAYMLADGSFTVADAYNCRVLFIRAGRIVRSYGKAGECRHDPPRYLGPINGDTPLPDGGVLVSEIEGSWVDEIGPEGKLRWAVRAPVSYPSDPQPLPGRRVLLADYASPGQILIMDHHGKVLWRYGPTGGYGRLDHPSLAMALPNGNIAVNDDYRARVIVIDPRRGRIVWQYGHTDHAGTASGYLNIPDGMDFIPVGPRGGVDWTAVVHP